MYYGLDFYRPILNIAQQLLPIGGDMWLVFGLGLMGLLLGFLDGMTSEAIVKPLITLLFAFVGGSVFVLLTKLTPSDRGLAGQMLSSLSLFCVLGVTLGVLTNQHRWLSANPIKAQEEFKLRNDPYLRSDPTSEVAIIDQRKQAKLITSDEAYSELYAAYNKLYNEKKGQSAQEGSH
jgi:hypothetical protein